MFSSSRGSGHGRDRNAAAKLLGGNSLDIWGALFGAHFGAHFWAIFGQLFELALWMFKQFIHIVFSRILLGPFLGNRSVNTHKVSEV